MQDYSKLPKRKRQSTLSALYGWLFLLLALSVLASADETQTETWCCSKLLFGDECLVRLTSQREGGLSGTGEVSVTGITHSATFSINGFERRWDFGEDYDFAFVIAPDGTGTYYDFSNSEDARAAPSYIYLCERQGRH